MPIGLTRIDRLARWLAGHTPRVEHDPAFTRAAVAIVLARDPEALLLIRRAERAGDPWSGQMGLPGGRRGQADTDLLATAIREAHEEIGFDLGGTKHLGQLDDLKPVTPVLPPIIVRPHVFLTPQSFEPALSDEIAAAWWIHLDHLLAPGVYGQYQVEALGRRMTRAGYRLGHGVVVWGMTERILTPALEVLRAE